MGANTYLLTLKEALEVPRGGSLWIDNTAEAKLVYEALIAGGHTEIYRLVSYPDTFGCELQCSPKQK
jgi:hypothetical protein